MDKLGGRKWALTVFGSICSTVFAGAGIIDGGDWITFQMFTIGAYNTANVFSKRSPQNN